MRRLILATSLIVALTLTAACSDNKSSSPQRSESEIRQGSYRTLVAAQPAHSMGDYSPTRRAINFWIDTWKEPDRLAFTYIRQTDGSYGYYILKGPPVSMCASLTPPYDYIDAPGDGTDNRVQVPAPGVDGAWYSGGQCSQYYGIDATTGAYVEFSIGLGQNYSLATEPLPNLGSDVHPLGPATVDKVAGKVKPSREG